MVKHNVIRITPLLKIKISHDNILMINSNSLLIVSKSSLLTILSEMKVGLIQYEISKMIYG